MGYALVLIFLAQVVYVSMVTVRWILLIKGARYIAAAVSFFEVLLYIYTLGVVVSNLGDWRNLVVYALGYSVVLDIEPRTIRRGFLARRIL